MSKSRPAPEPTRQEWRYFSGSPVRHRYWEVSRHHTSRIHTDSLCGLPRSGTLLTASAGVGVIRDCQRCRRARAFSETVGQRGLETLVEGLSAIAALQREIALLRGSRKHLPDGWGPGADSGFEIELPAENLRYSVTWTDEIPARFQWWATNTHTADSLVESAPYDRISDALDAAVSDLEHRLQRRARDRKRRAKRRTS